MDHLVLPILSILLLLPVTWPLTQSPLSATSTEGPPANVAGNRLVWFRDHAIRLCDNDALDAAVRASHDDKESCTIVPLYLWSSFDEKSPVNGATGGKAGDVFVANALDHLNQTLLGRLSLGMVYSGGSSNIADVCADELAYIGQRTGASDVYYLESNDSEFEESLRNGLRDRGLVPKSFGCGHTLLDYSKQNRLPWKKIIQEHPFRSPLIPFVDYLLEKLRYNPPPLPKPKPFGLEESIAPLREGAKGVVAIPLAIEDLLNVVGSVRGQTHWGSTIAKAWPASEEDAARALALFLDSLPSTSDPRGDDNDSQTQLKRTHLASRLSPYLARGVLSPRQVYHALSSSPDERARASFVRRICWRDYTYAVVSLFPDVTSGRPIREGYGRTVAEENGNDAGETKESHNRHLLRLWKNGATGFPLVDAGMRQLTAEGWMPQKVRLAVSTCLVEGLGGSWNDGMEHFAEYLVDYDPAINANMWMNAGCVGFDPYYVGTNYKRRPYWDKSGEYVRKWCPELRNLPDSWEVAEAQRGIGTFKVDCLYEPWSAPREILRASGVVLGETYPVRCCDERTERRRFFDTLRHKRAQWPSSGTDDRGRDVVRLGRSSDCESIGMFTPKALLGKPAAPVN